MKIFVAGGAGFIGSNFINFILSKYSQYQIINFDKILYPEQLYSLDNIDKRKKSYTFVNGDVTKKNQILDAFIDPVDVIINFVEEREISLSGIINLLDIAREKKIKKFIQVSTSDVYGSLSTENKFSEGSNIYPNNVNEAMKASEDIFAISYFKEYNLPTVILRGPQCYGSFQCPNKLISFIVTNLIEKKETVINFDKNSQIDLINILDQCRAIDTILHYGENGNIYNIGGNANKSLEKIVHDIYDLLNIDESLVKFKNVLIKKEIDCDKFYQKFNWTHKIDLGSGLKDTIQWYKENEDWWKNLKSRLKINGF